jgi:hypothetical protein
MPVSTADAFARRRFRLPPISTAMTKFPRISPPPPQRSFLSTPLNFYRHHSFSIDNISYRRCFRQLPFSAAAATCRHRFYRRRFLSTPLNFYRCRYYRQRFLSTSFSIDTDCYRHRFLGLSLFLRLPFSTAIATIAISATAILREVALCHGQNGMNVDSIYTSASNH